VVLAVSAAPVCCQKAWPGFARLVEDHHGVWAGCWCLNFHAEGRPHIHTPEQRRELKAARVREGRAHAALVYDGAQCVGWCQFGPANELPRIKHQKAYREGLVELPDWRITCFFIGRTHRGRGWLAPRCRVGRGPVRPGLTSPAGAQHIIDRN
jgi:hypothetical protein